jgi:hypothetical protein
VFLPPRPTGETIHSLSFYCYSLSGTEVLCRRSAFYRSILELHRFKALVSFACPCPSSCGSNLRNCFSLFRAKLLHSDECGNPPVLLAFGQRSTGMCLPEPSPTQRCGNNVCESPFILTCPCLAISSDLLATLNFFEQYAAAPYCPNNANSPGDKVTCAVGNCPLVEADGTLTLSEFQKYVPK